MITALLAAALLATGADEPKKAEKKNVSARELLEFVCKNNKAWTMKDFPLYEVWSDPKTRAEISVSVPEKLHKQLNALATSGQPWAATLPRMAALTPLYVRVSRQAEDPPTAKDVVAKFGEPDKKVGAWHVYGTVRLQVSPKGFIHTVQVDGEKWKKLTDDLEARAAAPAAAKADPAKDKETRADAYLKYAKKLLDKGEAAKAKGRLEEIVKDFAGTKAAVEAKALLEKLAKK